MTNPRKPSPSPLPTERAAQLLERVTKLYERAFTELPDGRDSLRARGIVDAGLVARFRPGYAAGRLIDLLPSRGDVRQELKRLGVLLEDDTERFAGCLVFPITGLAGELVTLLGIHPGDPVRQTLLPGRPPGIWNLAAVRCGPEVIITSSVLDALAVLILSSSGAGKTALQDATLGLCPPEDVVKLTALSGRALFYKDEHSLRHKVLALEEGSGIGEAAYAIRNLISAGELLVEATVRDSVTGRLTTMSNRVLGPTAVS